MIKYLLITLLVQDGENRHRLRILRTTENEDIKAAANEVASTYYGNDSELTDDWYYFLGGSIASQLENVIELSLYEYNLMDELFDGNRIGKPYFTIEAAGYNHSVEREEIQVHCGENGNLMIVKTPEGFVIDVYNQNDHIDTMTVWEDDLSPLEITIDPEIHIDRISEFLIKEGQRHKEITANLGYPKSHSESDELLMEDYFYLEGHKKWYPKNSSMFTDFQQAIANYLQNNRDNY